MLVTGLYDDHTQFQVLQKNLGSCTCANSGYQALVSNFFQAPVNEARHKFLPLVFVPRIHLGKVEAGISIFLCAILWEFSLHINIHGTAHACVNSGYQGTPIRLFQAPGNEARTSLVLHSVSTLLIWANLSECYKPGSYAHLSGSIDYAPYPRTINILLMFCAPDFATGN